jgi:hypothetical protein
MNATALTEDAESGCRVYLGVLSIGARDKAGLINYQATIPGSDSSLRACQK